MSGRGKGKNIAKKSVSRSAKAGLQFPVGRIARYLKKGKYAERIGAGAPVYLAAVMEYLAAEVRRKCGKERRGKEELKLGYNLKKKIKIGMLINLVWGRESGLWRVRN